MKTIPILICNVIATGLIGVGAESVDRVVGVWITEVQDGYIEIAKSQDGVYGTIIGAPVLMALND